MRYLSDEDVGLALFADRVTAEEKEKLVYSLTNEPGERKVRGDPATLKEAVSLADFGTTRTLKLLSQLDRDCSFLNFPPGQWSDIEACQKGERRVEQLRVVNDTAERGVKLF